MCKLQGFSGNICIDRSSDDHALSHVVVTPIVCYQRYLLNRYCPIQWPTNVDLLIGSPSSPDGGNVLLSSQGQELCCRESSTYFIGLSEHSQGVTEERLPEHLMWYLVLRGGEGHTSTSVHLCGRRDLWDIDTSHPDVLLKIAATIPSNEKHVIASVIYKEESDKGVNRLDWESPQGIEQILKHSVTLGYLSDHTWSCIEQVVDGRLKPVSEMRDAARRMREDISAMDPGEVEQWFPCVIDERNME
ncbi:hypothetical protein PSPO01_00625 [Paraphaeosphaeria sporulosa]